MTNRPYSPLSSEINGVRDDAHRPDRCPSCGLAWTAHEGMIHQCRLTRSARAALSAVVALVRVGTGTPAERLAQIERAAVAALEQR